MNLKRKVEIAVISDVHLGTSSCHAKQLLTYLNSIEPKKLILNGDIIDVWQFKKRDFPKSHLSVLKKIIDFASNGTEVIYIKGNHDEMLRKFEDTEFGNISVVNELVLNLDEKRAWFFHGDVLEISIKKAKWLAKLGSYDVFIILNRFITWCLGTFGKERKSIFTRLKPSKKSDIKYITDFENIATDLAIKNGYDYVICGHIHQPKMFTKETKRGKTIYLNSGDWVENFTALEYQFKRWKIYNYNKDKLAAFHTDEDLKAMEIRDFIATMTIAKQPKRKTKSKLNYGLFQN